MKQTLLQPVALVATFEPWAVLVWMAVVMLLSLTVVALFSRDRRWYELGAMFVLGVALIGAISGAFYLGLSTQPLVVLEFVTSGRMI